jgi:hypothetical protein
LEAAYRVQPLSKRHDRRHFSCGKVLLDRYLRKQAIKDGKRRLAATVVAVPRGSMVVAGYYSFSAASVDPGELPPHVTAKLPRYPRVPATLVARLARDRAHAGRGLG